MGQGRGLGCGHLCLPERGDREESRGRVLGHPLIQPCLMLAQFLDLGLHTGRNTPGAQTGSPWAPVSCN